MNPMQQQKVNLESMSPEDQELVRRYGKLPAKKNNLLMQRAKERKYFDSGDYALSKAGKSEETVGQKHPSPESIPHHPTPLSATLGPPVVGGTAAAPQVVPAAAAAAAPTEADSYSNSQNLVGSPPNSHIATSPLATGAGSASTATTSSLSRLAAGGRINISNSDSLSGSSSGVSQVPNVPPQARPPNPLLGNPAAGAPTPRPAFARRTSQLAGLQYRVKDPNQ